MQERARVLELCSRRESCNKSGNAIRKGPNMKVTGSEIMGSGSLFPFVISEVGKAKGRLTWNSMDTCGGSWRRRKFFVVDIYSSFCCQSVAVRVLVE